MDIEKLLTHAEKKTMIRTEQKWNYSVRTAEQ
jgi:hypothetical protein